MKKIILTFALCLCVPSAFASNTVQVRLLSDVLAERMVRAALDHCSEKGYSVAAVFVSRDGVPQAMLRHALASPVTIRIARNKAYTASNMRSDSEALGRRLAASHKRLVNLKGGRALEVAGHFYGGIGVSGATGEMDAKCSEAGIAAVIEDLEFEE